MKCLVVACVVAASWSSLAIADDLKGPPIDFEVRAGRVVKLPPIPAFEVPAPRGDVHDVRELRVLGKPLLGHKLEVSGYVTWIYDCVADLMRPGKTRARVQQEIDDDQTLCQRPKFYLGATKTTTPEHAIWVVGVPRAPTKLELRNLPKDELAKRPTPPKLAVGDYVVVTGTFDKTSPHGESNTDGLVVFAAIEHATPPASTGPLVPIPTIQLVASKLPAPVHAAASEPAKVTASKTEVAKGNTSFGQKQFDDAAAHYKAALAAWEGNHLAWYGLAAVAMAKHDYKTALPAAERATAMLPTSPVYQIALGAAYYENTIADAREAKAKLEGKKPDDVTVDLATLDFSKARDHFLLATSIEPRAWRAHTFLCKIMQAGGHVYEAADECGKAITSNAPEPGAGVELAQLYLTWEKPDLAIWVLHSAYDALPAATAPTVGLDLVYVLGLAQMDLADDVSAITTFSKILDDRPDHVRARFERGVLYMRTKQPEKAKPDLEAFLASAAPRLQFERALAHNLLLQIGSKP